MFYVPKYTLMDLDWKRGIKDINCGIYISYILCAVFTNYARISFSSLSVDIPVYWIYLSGAVIFYAYGVARYVRNYIYILVLI